MAASSTKNELSQETVDSLSREAETLKARLEEEKAKLNDVERKYNCGQ
jgi:hypothetical protein